MEGYKYEKILEEETSNRPDHLVKWVILFYLHWYIEGFDSTFDGKSKTNQESITYEILFGRQYIFQVHGTLT